MRRFSPDIFKGFGSKDEALNRAGKNALVIRAFGNYYIVGIIDSMNSFVFGNPYAYVFRNGLVEVKNDSVMPVFPKIYNGNWNERILGELMEETEVLFIRIYESKAEEFSEVTFRYLVPYGVLLGVALSVERFGLLSEFKPYFSPVVLKAISEVVPDGYPVNPFYGVFLDTDGRLKRYRLKGQAEYRWAEVIGECPYNWIFREAGKDSKLSYAPRLFP